MLRRTLLVASLLAVAFAAHASSVDRGHQLIESKVVYWGPASAPLSATLHAIYARTNPAMKSGPPTPLSVANAGTYEMLPLSLGKIREWSVKFAVFTAPASIPSRAKLLDGVDGVVFVTTGEKSELTATRRSWTDLTDALARHGVDLRTLGLAIQLSAPPSPTRIGPDAVRALLELPPTVPIFETNPATGDGVMEPLKAVSKQVLKRIRDTGK